MQEKIIALGILVFALIYLAGSISLSVGTLTQPDPGFMPAAIAALLLVAAALNAYRCFRQAAEDKGTGPLLKPMGVALVTLAYPFLLRPLHYLLATFIVLFILFRLFRYKSPAVSFLLSAVITVASFVIFSKLLGVVLPAGTLEDMILRL